MAERARVQPPHARDILVAASYCYRVPRPPPTRTFGWEAPKEPAAPPYGHTPPKRAPTPSPGPLGALLSRDLGCDPVGQRHGVLAPRLVARFRLMGTRWSSNSCPISSPNTIIPRMKSLRSVLPGTSN